MPERGRGPGRLIKILLLSLAAVPVAYLSFRSAVVNDVRDGLLLASMIAPDNPRVMLMQSAGDSMNLIVSADALEQAKRALPGAPLAAEPFAIAGLEAVGRGSNDAIPLLMEARRREPRNPLPRLLILNHYLETGQAEKAVPELAAVGRLLPQASELLLHELAARVQNRASRPVVAQALASSPVLREQLLHYLAVRQPDPQLILPLADPNRLAFTGNRRQWQVALVSSLARLGRYREAKDLWRQFLPPQLASEQGLIFNPSFKDLPAPAPFNWKLSSGGEGAVETTGDGALEVDYYGRSTVDFAEQVLVLGPGRYSFSVEAEQSGTSDGRLAWQLSCLPGNNVLMDLDLAGEGPQAERLTADFQVPANCVAQRLRLRGIAGEFPAALSAVVRRPVLSATGS